MSRLLSLMLLWLLGCRSPSEPESNGFGPAHPVLGINLVPNALAIAPTWSADTRDVLFLDVAPTGGYALYAVSTASRQVRSISEPVSVTNSGRNAVKVAYATHTPFFAATVPSERLVDHLYRVRTPGATPEPMLTDMEWPWFSISADEHRVAYSRISGDGTQAGVALVVLDFDSGTERIARTGWDPPRTPFSLSPDGEWLIYTAAMPYGSEAVELFSFESSSSMEVWPGTDVENERRVWSHDVLWEGNTPHLVFVQREEGERRFSINRMNGRTGVVTALAEVPDAEGLPWAVSWSHDGAKVALWTPIETGPWCCSTQGDLISRRVIHWRLYVWTESEAWSTVAEVALSEGTRWLSFSPDASSVGYQLFGQIYVERLE